MKKKMSIKVLHQPIFSKCVESASELASVVRIDMTDRSLCLHSYHVLGIATLVATFAILGGCEFKALLDSDRLQTSLCLKTPFHLQVKDNVLVVNDVAQLHVTADLPWETSRNTVVGVCWMIDTQQLQAAFLTTCLGNGYIEVSTKTEFITFSTTCSSGEICSKIRINYDDSIPRRSIIILAKALRIFLPIFQMAKKVNFSLASNGVTLGIKHSDYHIDMLSGRAPSTC